MASPSLAERLDALEEAAELSGRRVDPALSASIDDVLDKVRERARHGTDHTVVALAGATGVGKSSLFNALVGTHVSSPGVRRPTTGVAHAAAWGDAPPALLDWLAVPRRHHVDVPDDDPLAGLVLIDLPDFDSTEVANRAEVDRLVELVDGLVWVTDPQKYADEAFHEGYVRPLAGYQEVMSFVVNKIDTVPAEQRPALLDDVRARVVADGVTDPTVYVTSVTAGTGVDAVRSALADAVARRRSMVARLESDLRGAAAALGTDLELVDGGGEGRLAKRHRREFVDRIGHAAGVDRAGEIVAAQHRHDARAAMGWPPAKLLSRWRRRHPIADLPRATGSAAASSEIRLALRDVGEAAADGLGPAWRQAMRRVTDEHAAELTGRLTSVTDDTAREAVGRPRWWVGVRAVQHVLTVAVVVGALWLLVAALLGGFLGFDTDPLLIDTPGAEWIPLPSLLVLGGLLVGFVVALVTRIPVAIAARRRARRVRGVLRRRVGELADETVLGELERAHADRARLGELLRAVRA